MVYRKGAREILRAEDGRGPCAALTLADMKPPNNPQSPRRVVGLVATGLALVCVPFALNAALPPAPRQPASEVAVGDISLHQDCEQAVGFKPDKPFWHCGDTSVKGQSAEVDDIEASLPRFIRRCQTSNKLGDEEVKSPAEGVFTANNTATKAVAVERDDADGTYDFIAFHGPDAEKFQEQIAEDHAHAEN